MPHRVSVGVIAVGARMGRVQLELDQAAGCGRRMGGAGGRTGGDERRLKVFQVVCLSFHFVRLFLVFDP
jgi:hypothetical protein